MKVIFLEDVPGTADAGEVRDVKNGFARNFLLPRGLAAPATPDQLQRTRAIEKAAQETRLKLSDDWNVIAKAIEGLNVRVEVRIGPSGRLFGAVTGRQIAEKLSEQTGRELNHRQVLLGEAIHEPGDYQVNVRLYREVLAQITVSVVPDHIGEGQTDLAAAAEVEVPTTEAPSADAEQAAGTIEEATSASVEEPEAPVDETPDSGPEESGEPNEEEPEESDRKE